ncbi:MAG: hypothetical protein GY748_11285, partial [Planctomycetaceae bacterium]|nr:hypothetical protein [Planctomycetaceae bacterium]
MDNTTDDNSGKSGQSTDLSTFYRIELDAACDRLNAKRSDLEQLLGYIHANNVSRRRLSDMLKNAFSSLGQLRESETD